MLHTHCFCLCSNLYCVCSLQDSPTNQQSDNARQEGQGDLHSSDSEDDDAIIKLEKGKSPETKPPLGGVRVLPPLQLVDQIQLLTSGSKNWPTDQSVPEDDDGDEPSSEPAESKIRKASLSRQDSASSDTEKMKISSNQPPWIEMVLVSLCGVPLVCSYVV